MKIAFLLTQSLDSPSGLGRYGPITRGIAALGHEVELYALHYSWKEVSPKAFVDRGVHVRYVGQMHVRKEGPRKSYFNPIQLAVISLASTFRLARALYRSDADIIQLCKPQPFNVLAARIGGRGRPVYCDCDDYEAYTNRFSGKWQQVIVRYFEDGIINFAAGITTNTQFTRHRYIDLGYPKEQTVYVPNGVERERFDTESDWNSAKERIPELKNINPDDPLILYVGTLGLLSHPIDLLLEAFVEVVKQIPTSQLALVGSGEDFDKLRTMSQELGIDSQTFFLGRQPPEAIPLILSQAAVTVDPIHDDLIARARSPLKVLESLVLGVPVVTGDVGDRRQMLQDGAAGVLSAPGSSQAIAEGILSILSDPELRMQMKEAASAGREEWYWDNLVRDFMQVYDL